MKLAQWLKSRTFRTQKSRRMKGFERRPRLVERLEDRSLLATFTVALTGNDSDPVGLGGGSYRTIQAAIVAASSTSDGPDEIRAATGNYNVIGTDERFDISSSANLETLKLLGGWDAGFATQNPAATPTDYTFTNSPAANRYDIQVLDPDTTIDGFTFNSSDGATARDADTILSQATGTTISHNIFNVGIRSSTAQPRPAGVVTGSVDNSGLLVSENVFNVGFTGTPASSSAAVGVFLNPRRHHGVGCP